MQVINHFCKWVSFKSAVVTCTNKDNSHICSSPFILQLTGLSSLDPCMAGCHPVNVQSSCLPVMAHFLPVNGHKRNGRDSEQVKVDRPSIMLMQLPGMSSPPVRLGDFSPCLPVMTYSPPVNGHKVVVH